MTDDTVTAKLAEWEALTEAATEGPWEAADHEGPAVFVPEKGLMHSIDYLLTTADEERGWSDAELIAAARTAMPALIGFVEDVRAACEKAKANPAEDGSGKVHTAVIEQALTTRIGGEG